MEERQRKRWRSTAVVHDRARELRARMTPAEQRLWRCLRRGTVRGYRFRRQHPVGPFIVDFFCPAVGLVIEVDGDVHAGQREYDAARTRWLRERRGLRLLRFTNDEVMGNLDGVLEVILRELSRCP